MAHEADPIKWCNVCHGDGCSRCVPPRQHLASRCEWCGTIARHGTFCSKECAASSFEAGALWSRFATDALQQYASDEAESVVHRFGTPDRSF
jgi:hypothetical protein